MLMKKSKNKNNNLVQHKYWKKINQASNIYNQFLLTFKKLFKYNNKSHNYCQLNLKQMKM